MDLLFDKLKSLLELVTEETFLVEVTVPTGLESVAINEIKSTFNVEESLICHVKGRIYFVMYLSSFDKIQHLRSVDNVSIVADVVTDLNFSGDEEKHTEELRILAIKLKMGKPVQKWATVSNFKGRLYPTYAEFADARDKQAILFTMKKENEECNGDALKHNVLKFRVSCDRTGTHSFTSMYAARVVGGRINDFYHWVVALCDWDLNIILRICNNDAMTLLKVTPQSLHKRQIIAFGAMTLRPTIAYGMLALANLKPGDHMIDPLCGSGSIPIECMHAYPTVVVSCGDISSKAIDKSITNINHQRSLPSKPTLFKWCASRLPYQRNTIDAIVTDLPFGKRSGSKGKNFKLYKSILDEFARVIKHETGRIVLLTKDSVHLLQAMGYKRGHSFWKITDIRKVNVGALKCTLICARLGP